MTIECVPWRQMALALAASLLLAGCSDDATRMDAGAPAVLLVPVAPVHSAPGYDVRREFAGRVEAARASAIGFEIAGQLAEVLVDEGARVEAGDPLARLDTARLQARQAEARATLTQATASLALAETTLERITEALEFKGVSRQEYDEAVRAERAARSGEAAARARLDSIGVDLAKSVLRAPYAATVTDRLADEGEVLAPGQVMLELQERAPPRVRIGVAADMLDAVRDQQEHLLNVDGVEVRARVRAILPLRDATTRTVDVIMELGGEAAVLPGDIARLEIARAVEQPGFWVPLGSLTEGERGTWTHYVAVPLGGDSPGGEATHVIEARAVEVLYEEADRVYVRGALEETDRIVVDGLHRVVPGQAVRIGIRQARGPSETEQE